MHTLVADFEIAEVANRAGTHPESNSAFGVALLQVVDDQRRLLRSMDKQACLVTPYLNLHLCPFAGYEVHVGFVLSANSLRKSCHGNPGTDTYWAE